MRMYSHIIESALQEVAPQHQARYPACELSRRTAREGEGLVHIEPAGQQSVQACIRIAAGEENTPNGISVAVGRGQSPLSCNQGRVSTKTEYLDAHNTRTQSLAGWP